MRTLSLQRLLAGCLTVWIPLTGIASAADAMPKSFVDVSRDEWFAPYVQAAVQRGFASGYKDANGFPNGYFGPSNNVTYAEALSMIMRMTNTDVGGEPYNLSAANTWAAPYVATAEAMGLTVYGKGLNVNSPASRGAVAQTLMEISRLSKPRGYLHFSDLPETHQYYAAVEALAEAGIMQGDARTNTIQPDAYINRAEICKILALLSGSVHTSSAALSDESVQSVSSAATSGGTSSSSSVAIQLSGSQRLVKQPVNMRSGMGMEYRSIMQLPANTVVNLESENGVWSKIRLMDGTEGYVVTSYLLLPGGYVPASLTSAGSASSIPHAPAVMPGQMVVNHPVKVRSGPSMEHASQFEMPTGTVVSVLDREGVWAQVRLFDGRTGYVVQKYLSNPK